MGGFLYPPGLVGRRVRDSDAGPGYVVVQRPDTGRPVVNGREVDWLELEGGEIVDPLDCRIRRLLTRIGSLG